MDGCVTSVYAVGRGVGVSSGIGVVKGSELSGAGTDSSSFSGIGVGVGAGVDSPSVGTYPETPASPSLKMDCKLSKDGLLIILGILSVNNLWPKGLSRAIASADRCASEHSGARVPSSVNALV